MLISDFLTVMFLMSEAKDNLSAPALMLAAVNRHSSRQLAVEASWSSRQSMLMSSCE